MEVNNLYELYENTLTHTHTIEDRVEGYLHLILSPPFEPEDWC